MHDLLEKLSITIDNAYNSKIFVSVIKDFFKKELNIDYINIYVYDNKLKTIKDFSVEWINPDENKEQTCKLDGIYNKIKLSNFIEQGDLIYYALPKSKKNIGFIELKKAQLNNSIINNFLRIANHIISLKIQNILLAETMQKNIDFHELMRNIAKIIETQYELDYIIPLIGEMIDKFLANILTYIFVRENGEFKLLWPANCKDTSILDEVAKLDEQSQYKIISERKTGIFPLVNENKLLGCIAAKSMVSPLTNSDINNLEQLAKQSSATINRANVYSEILKHATLDALTGFYNRRQLEERIKQETAKAKRQKTPLCAIMTDIDFFKKVNDIYGHAAGDLVLKLVSKTIRSQLREYDIAGRYGGEEFALLLPFTRTEEAVMVAERLRHAVENTIIDLTKVNPESPQKTINVTISIGIYEFKTTDNTEDLLKKADKALYEAKDTGRNKVIINRDEK